MLTYYAELDAEGRTGESTCKQKKNPEKLKSNYNKDLNTMITWIKTSKLLDERNINLVIIMNYKLKV